MGGMFARRWMEMKVFGPEHIIVTGRNEGKLKPLADAGLRRMGNAEAAQEAGIILLAVKPKDIAAVAEEIAPYCKGKLVISIAAGTPVSVLNAKLEGARVVRAMPNIACSVGEGVVALYARGAGKRIRQELDRLFGSMGKLHWVGERAIELLTGISGSGPAYVFNLIAELETLLLKAGLNAGAARSIAAQTFLGAAKVMQERADSPVETLTGEVACPNGTTEKGLIKARQLGLFELFGSVVDEGSKKALQMSREAKQKFRLEKGARQERILAAPRELKGL